MEEIGPVAEPRLRLRHICRCFHRPPHRLQDCSTDRVAIQTTLKIMTLPLNQISIELYEEVFIIFLFIARSDISTP